MNLETSLSRAKIQLMYKKNSTFIATVLFSLNTSFTEKIPTAGTDGINLFINPTWWAGLTTSQRIGLLFHETFHVVFNHMMRGKDLLQIKYNIAADYVINIMAIDQGYDLPPNGYIKSKYRNWSTRKVYDDLPNDICNNKGIGNDIIYVPDDISKEEIEKRELDLTNILLKATTASIQQKDEPGSIPSEVEVMIQEIINPKLPWEVLLQNFMTDYAKDDFTWSRPNRRFLPDFYLPSAHSEAVGHIAVAIDTSCSVSDAEFNAFRNEIQGIKELLNPELITIIDFDTKIKQIRLLKKDDDFTDLKFHGRGGTNITPVWKWADKENPLVLIIFTDGEFAPPIKKIDTDILWIIIDNPNIKKLPFGITIDMHVD